MWASWNGDLEVVRTLLESGGDLNAKSYVRNQLMMIILLTIFLMLMMMMMMIVINDEDRDVCR
jgi:ankyrin repeat protein